MLKRNRGKQKKTVTKFNRNVVRIKKRFGLIGIAVITPFVGIPIGAYIAERFYKDKKRVIMYLSVAAIVWAIIFYFLLYFFYGAFKKWGVID